MIYIAPECTAFDDPEVEKVVTMPHRHVNLYGIPISHGLFVNDKTLVREAFVFCFGREIRLTDQSPFTIKQMAVMEALAQYSWMVRSTGVTGPKLMEGDPCLVLTCDYRRVRVVGQRAAPMGDGPYWNLQSGVWRMAAVGVETRRELVVESRCELLIGAPCIRDNVIEQGKYLR